MTTNIEVKYVDGGSQSFVALFRDNKMIGEPISLWHYSVLSKEHDKESLTQYLSTLSKEEWNGLCLSSILNWR